MLQKADNDRPAASRDIEKSLHLKQVGAAQRRERRHETAERSPIEWRVASQQEMANVIGRVGRGDRRMLFDMECAAERAFGDEGSQDRSELFAGLDDHTIEMPLLAFRQ